MKKATLAILVCIAILVAGCSSAVPSSSGTDSKETSEAAAEAGSEEISRGVSDTDSAEAGSEEISGEGPDVISAEAGAEEISGEGPDVISSEAGSQEISGEGPDVIAAEAGSQEISGEGPDVISPEAGTADTAAGAEGETEKDGKDISKAAAADPEKTAKVSDEDKEKAEKEKTEEAKKKAAEKKEKEEKEAEEKRQREEEEIAGDYVPEGFSPYGMYILVYDSGYVVKSRYSAVGITFYYEGEEFFFIQDKKLPDMKKNVAHMIFNENSPMTAEEAAGEEFPFTDPYVLQITLDDGSYYEVYSSQLDLHSRRFVNELFETFRVKYEGKF